MSEAVIWPIEGSEQELAIDESASGADIIPFTNRTELPFNKVTQQELTDYIGQTAKNIGIGLEIGWSENYGICFYFFGDEDIASFDELLCQFELEQAGENWNPNNPGASGLLALSELPKQEVVLILSDEQEGSFMSVKACDRVRCLTPFHDTSTSSSDSQIDKLNRYNFADFLLSNDEEVISAA